MKREKKKLKTMALSAVLAAGMLLPMSATAQFDRGDGFFRSDSPQNRDGIFSSSTSNEFFNIDGNDNQSGSTEPFNFTDVPLGSGLLIMLAAGAGYAILKRVKSLKFRVVKR